MGARSAAEARGYFVGRLVRSWGVNAARAFARHRLSRTCLVGLTRDQLPTRTVHRGYGGPGDAAWDLRQPSVWVPRAHRPSAAAPAAAATCGASERRESPARRSSAPMRCARSMREHRIK